MEKKEEKKREKKEKNKRHVQTKNAFELVKA